MYLQLSKAKSCPIVPVHVPFGLMGTLSVLNDMAPLFGGEYAVSHHCHGTITPFLYSKGLNGTPLKSSRCAVGFVWPMYCAAIWFQCTGVSSSKLSQKGWSICTVTCSISLWLVDDCTPRTSCPASSLAE